MKKSAKRGKQFDDLLLEQLPQVKYIARRIHERLPQHVPFEDLVHAGIVGLIDAMHKYRRRQECALRVLRQVPHSRRHSRQPAGDGLEPARPAAQGPPRGRADPAVAGTNLGHSPTEPELAQAMGLSLEDFQHLLDEIRGLDLGSLQVESLEDGRETNLADMIAGPSQPRSAAHLPEGERRQMLAKAIAQLPAREQQVLALYYQEELTMKETGEVLGVGESRVSQIHSLAVARLRSILAEMRQIAGGSERGEFRRARVGQYGKGPDPGRDRCPVPGRLGSGQRRRRRPAGRRRWSAGTCTRRGGCARSSCTRSASCTKASPAT